MRSGTPVKVKKLGHVVFTVSDVERTTVALVPAEAPHEPPREGQPGFHHCALEVGTVSHPLPGVTYQ